MKKRKIVSYMDNGYYYFWDPWTRNWSIYGIVKRKIGNKIIGDGVSRDTLLYFKNKALMQNQFPSIKFKKCLENVIWC